MISKCYKSIPYTMACLLEEKPSVCSFESCEGLTPITSPAISEPRLGPGPFLQNIRWAAPSSDDDIDIGSMPQWRCYLEME